MPKAVIQVPAYQEPQMLSTLEQIAEQEPPAGWTVDREVWVTLSPPDRELCTTWQSALDARGFEPHEAPAGKLSARNAAHHHAVQASADVIVAWDADAPPQSPDTLAELLAPFELEDVVAANGNPVSPPGIGTIVNAIGKLDDRIRPQMHGQLSAFTAEAWRAAGPFDTDRDQTDVKHVRKEEEFAFRQRLEDVGEVVDVPSAKVLNDTRRAECRVSRAFSRFGREQEGYCQRTGTTTFHPRRNRRNR